MIKLLKSIGAVFFLFLVGSFWACEETIEWDLEPGENGKLVVEAILTNELIVQEVRLSQSVDTLNEISPKVSDATVSVEVNGTSYSFSADPLEEGLYKSDLPFIVLADLEYRLNIVWQGELYHAGSYLSNVFPIPPINFIDVAGTDSLRFDESSYVYNFNQQAMYEMIIDWSAVISAEKTQAKIVFFTFNDLDVSAIVPPAEENLRFPKGSTVFLTKYGLNDDFAGYLRSLAIETVWAGGPFYGASSSLPTNISNNGLGYYSTCAVLRDTFIAE